MRKILAKLLRADVGATAVEYAVMLALILMVIFGAVATVGLNSKSSLQNSNTQLNSCGFGS